MAPFPSRLVSFEVDGERYVMTGEPDGRVRVVMDGPRRVQELDMPVAAAEQMGRALLEVADAVRRMQQAARDPLGRSGGGSEPAS